ncbi:MAG: phosphoribosyltransferase family protein [Patescibacteria group bacterium]
MLFRDRTDAAQKLLAELQRQQIAADVVLALPRGGVVLGKLIADGLGVPLDLVIPRKIGAQGDPEYAIGAITENGIAVWNEAEKERAGPIWLKKIMAEETAEARRRRAKYLPGGKRVPVTGKRVLVVDDGIATGLTMRAAVTELRAEGAAHITVAVPVAPQDGVDLVLRNADHVVVLHAPPFFGALGAFYTTFDQVSDDEVIRLLRA